MSDTTKPLFECVSCGCMLPGRHDIEGVCHHCAETKDGYEGCEEMYSTEALEFQQEVWLREVWEEIIATANNEDPKYSFELFKGFIDGVRDGKN